MNFKSLKDIVLHYMMTSDIREVETMDELVNDIDVFLLKQGYTSYMIQKYLNFKIKWEDGGDLVKVVPNNLTTALWFSEEYRQDLPNLDSTEMVLEGKKYIFKKNKLKISDAK